jgi:hypothetical protein
MGGPAGPPGTSTPPPLTSITEPGRESGCCLALPGRAGVAAVTIQAFTADPAERGARRHVVRCACCSGRAVIADALRRPQAGDLAR